MALPAMSVAPNNAPSNRQRRSDDKQRQVLHKTASVKLEPSRSASDRLAPVRLAPSSRALRRLASSRLALTRLACVRSEKSRQTPSLTARSAQSRKDLKSPSKITFPVRWFFICFIFCILPLSEDIVDTVELCQY